MTTPGQVLSLSGEKAQEYGLATRVVENFTQFKQNYGLENDPTLVEPGWVDHLAHFLGRPGMVAMLIFLGGLGIYIELHAPGLGIGAFIAVVAFALFFWSHFLEGTAGWLEVTLFVTGCICLLTEIFVLPGFVIFGLGGGVLILASIVLASQTFFIPQNEYQFARLQSSLLALTLSVGGLIARDLGLEPLAAPRAGAAACLSCAAGRRRGRDHQPPRDAGRSGQPRGRRGRGDHSPGAQRQGPLRQPPGRRDLHAAISSPATARSWSTEVHGNRVVVRLASGGNSATG